MDVPATVSKTNDMDGLTLSSDESFRDWANLNGFPGDGTGSSPFIIEGMVFSNYSSPPRVLVDIVETWFVFSECIFMSNDSRPALSTLGIANGVFSGCGFLGVVEYNSSSNCVFHDSQFLFPVQAIESSDSVFYSNVFDDEANVYVGSWGIPSNNVSFFENEFYGELHLADATNCYVINNIFYWQAIDDGSDNYWDGNDYFNYDGTGPYEIPGLAGSVDDNPFGRPGTTTEWPPPLPPPPNGDFGIDSLLFQVIIMELVIIAIILFTRRQRVQ
ncbi:MAG: hypothetical protein ACFFEX_11685 [Candidatus Thorarchaeota archaeon]